MSKPLVIVRGIAPSAREKSEWARFASACSDIGRSDVAARFKAAVALPDGARIPIGEFDALQYDYRAWLVFNEYPPKSPATQEASRECPACQGSGFIYVDKRCPKCQGKGTR